MAQPVFGDGGSAGRNLFSTAQAGDVMAARQSLPPMTRNAALGETMDQPYGDLLGGNLEVNRPNAMDRYSYGMRIGPEAYKDKQVEMYQQTLEDAIAREESWITTDDWAPLEQVSQRHFYAKIRSWDRNVQHRYPNLGVVPMIRHSERIERATIVQYAEGFEMEQEFMDTNEGSIVEAGNIIAVARNMINTVNFIVAQAFLTAHTNHQKWQMTFGVAPDGLINVEELLGYENDIFCAAQKGTVGLDGLFDRANALIREEPSNNGAGATGIALPAELLSYVNRFSRERTDYYIAGPEGPRRLERDGRYAITSYRGIRVFETKNHITNNQGSQLQMLRRPRVLGEYYLDNAHHLADSILGNTADNVDYKFKTWHRDIAIYNENVGAYQYVSFAAAVRNCGLFNVTSGEEHPAYAEFRRAGRDHHFMMMPARGQNDNEIARVAVLGNVSHLYLDAKILAASFITWLRRQQPAAAAAAGQQPPPGDVAALQQQIDNLTAELTTAENTAANLRIENARLTRVRDATSVLLGKHDRISGLVRSIFKNVTEAARNVADTDTNPNELDDLVQAIKGSKNGQAVRDQLMSDVKSADYIKGRLLAFFAVDEPALLQTLGIDPTSVGLSNVVHRIRNSIYVVIAVYTGRINLSPGTGFEQPENLASDAGDRFALLKALNTTRPRGGREGEEELVSHFGDEYEHMLLLPAYAEGDEEVLGLDTYDGQLSIAVFGEACGYPEYLVELARDRVAKVHALTDDAAGVKRVLSALGFDADNNNNNNRTSRAVLMARRALYRQVRLHSEGQTAHAPSLFLREAAATGGGRSSTADDVQVIDARSLFMPSATATPEKMVEVAKGMRNVHAPTRVMLGGSLGTVMVRRAADLPRVALLQAALGVQSAPLFAQLLVRYQDDREALLDALVAAANTILKKSTTKSPAGAFRRLVAALATSSEEPKPFAEWLEMGSAELSEDGASYVQALVAQSKIAGYSSKGDTPLLGDDQQCLHCLQDTRPGRDSVGDKQLALQATIGLAAPADAAELRRYLNDAKRSADLDTARAAESLERHMMLAASSSSQATARSSSSSKFIAAPSLAYTRHVHAAMKRQQQRRRSTTTTSSISAHPCDLHDHTRPVTNVDECERMHRNGVFGTGSAPLSKTRQEHLQLFDQHDAARLGVPRGVFVRTHDESLGNDQNTNVRMLGNLIREHTQEGTDEQITAFLQLEIGNFGDISRNFLGVNVLLPFTLLLVRPFIQHLMSSALVVRGGASTARTLVGTSRVLISTDNQHGKMEWSIRYYAGAIVMNPRNVVLLEDIFSHRYQGGRNCRLISPGASKDEASNNLNAARTGGNDRASVVAILLPSSTKSLPRLLSMSGLYPYPAAHDQLVGQGRDVYHGQEYYASFLHPFFGETSLRQDRGSETYWAGAEGFERNVTAMQGAQQLYSTQTRSHTLHISSSSAFTDGLSYDQDSKALLNGQDRAIPTNFNWTSISIRPDDQN